MALRLEGKPVAEEIQRALTAEVAAIKAGTGVIPTLAVVLIGEDPPSKVYVGRKRRVAAEIGIGTRDCLHPRGLSQGDLLALIHELNDDKQVHGILVQLPLPKGLDERRVLDAIDPAKDADGLHPENLGHVLIGDPTVVPCTPAGIMAILDHYRIALPGRSGVVIGRSRLVGKPVAQLLLARDVTVTMAHSKTPDLAGVARGADVLVVAAGRAGLVGADHVKPGAVVVDVGMNRLPDGKLVGDVDYAAVEPVAAAITPAPGGVGPTTVAMLMRNTVGACRRQLAGT